MDRPSGAGDPARSPVWAPRPGRAAPTPPQTRPSKGARARRGSCVCHPPRRLWAPGSPGPGASPGHATQGPASEVCRVRCLGGDQRCRGAAGRPAGVRAKASWRASQPKEAATAPGGAPCFSSRTSRSSPSPARHRSSRFCFSPSPACCRRYSWLRRRGSAGKAAAAGPPRPPPSRGGLGSLGTAHSTPVRERQGEDPAGGTDHRRGGTALS